MKEELEKLGFEKQGYSMVYKFKEDYNLKEIHIHRNEVSLEDKKWHESIYLFKYNNQYEKLKQLIKLLS